MQVSSCKRSENLSLTSLTKKYLKMKSPIRILSIDDNPLDRELVRDALNQDNGNFEIIEESNRANFEELITAAGTFDIILSDFNILGFTGLQVLEVILEKCPGTPVIMLTGTGSEEMAVETMKRGAADYVLKTDRHIKRLPHTIRAVLESSRLEKENQRVQENLRASEYLHREFMNGLPVAVYTTDIDGRIILYNHAAVEMWGRRPEAGDHWCGSFKLYRLDNHLLPHDACPIALAIKENRSINGIEAIVERKDGSRINILAYATPFRDKSGEVIGAMNAMVEITERKRIEEKLQLNEQHLRLSLEAGKMGSWVWDLHSNLSFWNQQEYQLLGLPPGDGQVDTDLFFEHVHPEDLPGLKLALSESMKYHTSFKHHFRIIRADGLTRWISGRGQVSQDDISGNPQQILGINFDITESKEADEKLRQTTAELQLRFRQQQALANLGELALQANDLGNLFQTAIDMICQVLELEFGKILELQHDGQTLLLRAGVGWKEGLVGTAMISGGKDSQAGYTLLSDQPVIVVDLNTETRFSGPALLRDHGIASGISVVIRGGSVPYGVLGVHTRQHREFNQYDPLFLQNVATLLGNFIERQRLDTQYRQLIQSVQDYAILRLSTSGTVTMWNSGAERMMGFKAEEVIGQSDAIFYLPEDVASGKPKRILEEAATHGRAEHEGWRLKKNNTRLLVDAVTFALTDDAGCLTGYSRIIRDITLKKREDESLRSVVDHSSDVIVTIDDKGIMQSCSGSLQKVFGYDPARIIGQNVNLLMPDPWKSHHDGYISAYLRTGLARIIGKVREVTGCRESGELFPLELAITEFTLDGARFFTGIMRDITTRKKLEDELRQSQKMEAIGQLAGGIAHDFNNLLTIINGFSELLIYQLSSNDSQKKMLLEIMNAGNRAADLTRQLLAYSRKQVLAPLLLNLNNVILNIEKMLQRLIGEDIMLSTNLDPQLRMVKVDPSQMETAIMNLAINARDAMPRGGKLTIATSNIEVGGDGSKIYTGCQSGSYVKTTIADTGSGMSPAIMSRIFEPFFSTKEVGKGTGLGLAMVFGFVKQSEGHISVSSEIGMGTTFTILLPVVKEHSEGTKRDEKIQPLPRGNETILIVEDEDSVRRFARMALEMQGYKVYEASNGQNAINLIETLGITIKLIISDVVMPEMSGRQLVDLLRRFHPDLKVLFISGYTDDAVVRYGVSHATEAFLHKPFDKNELTQKVRAVLDDRIG